MKVLASGMEWFSENPGGLPRYFADYLQAWTRSGEFARGCVRTSTSSASGQRPPYVYALPLKTGNPLQVRRAWAKWFRAQLERETFDVFNPHFAYYAWAWADLKLELPVVTHFHGPWAYETRVENTQTARWRKAMEFQLQRWIEHRAYQASDRFIVLSKSFRDVLAGRYGVQPDRIDIIPGAVNMDRFYDHPDRDMVRTALSIPPNRFVILTVRRLVRRMGLDNLIRAIGELRKRFPEVFLMMVGGGELFGELTDLVNELGLSDHVRLTNRVPDEQLPMFYQAADLTVVPTIALEGFGFVTVESLASGTPVAGTPVGGTREILEKFNPRLLFEGSSTPHLVEGLQRILLHPGQLPTRRETREHALRHYTWDVVVPKIRASFRRAGGTT